jgi:hypothetical protein
MLGSSYRSGELGVSYDGTNSPPSSIPRPLTSDECEVGRSGCEPLAGGTRLSKFSRRRPAADGVLLRPGVLHAACAGLGVTFR